MTIDEAIKHCEEVATEKEDNARWELTSTWKDECIECAAEHRQLAEWLKELKSLRKKAEHLTEWNSKLIDYKNEIICKWDKSQEELKEAKRLLLIRRLLPYFPVEKYWLNIYPTRMNQVQENIKIWQMIVRKK